MVEIHTHTVWITLDCNVEREKKKKRNSEKKGVSRVKNMW